MSRKILFVGAALAAGVLSAQPAHAVFLQSQEQTVDFNLIGDTSSDISYNKFDVTKGKLVSVTLDLKGVHTGSFRIKNALGTSNTLNGVQHGVDILAFSPNAGSPTDPNPIAGALALVAGTGSSFTGLQTKTINFSGQLSPESYDFSAFLDYFKGNPSSSFLITLQNSFQSDPLIGFSNFNTDNSIYGALQGATLTYTYDVPGPLPLLGAGAAFGWSRKLRRRIKVVGRTANA